MICAVCDAVLQREQSHTKRPRYNTQHHPTVFSLVTAVAAQCYICNRIWARLATRERDIILSLASAESVENPRAEVSIDEEEDGGHVTVCDLSDAAPFGFPGCCLLSITLRNIRKISARATLILQPLSRKNPVIFNSAYFKLETDSDVEVDEYSKVETIETSITSEKSWSLAQRWIAECTASHTRCKITPEDENWHPTRLLDVASPDRTSNIICLMESKELASGSAYITLSHRWGDAKPLQLRRDTYAQLRSGITLDSMPPTFRDAVLVARHLSIRYIWIDALCIIQNEDDLSDWSNEASLMHKVYSAAYCNISAAAASDSLQGFFVSRDPQLLVSPTIQLTLEDSIPGDFLVSDFNFWDTEVSLAAINSRGWVLQERILANRILHFGERQLMWECGEKDAAEIYPNGLPKAISTGSDVRFKDLCPNSYLQQIRRFKGLSINPGVSAHLLWMRVVEAYSRCQLTKPDDKLPALSGIAKRMSVILGDDYVAGMWRRYLASELIWFVEPNSVGKLNHELAGRPASYRAPSFSWASVDGVITPGLPSDKGILLEIEGVHLDYVTNDITGAIKGGYLQLRGRLKQVQLLRRLTEGRNQWILLLNGTEISTMQEPGCAGEMQPFVRLDDPREDSAASIAGKSLYCIPVRISTDPEGNLYLLLLEILENARGIFRRIGFARSFVQITKEAFLATSENEPRLPCREYCDGLHSITII